MGGVCLPMTDEPCDCRGSCTGGGGGARDVSEGSYIWNSYGTEAPPCPLSIDGALPP